jgi:hypothetical protein
MQRRILLLGAGSILFTGCSGDNEPDEQERTTNSGTRSASETVTPPEDLKPRLPREWEFDGSIAVFAGDLGDDIESAGWSYMTPNEMAYRVVIIQYPVEADGGNKTGVRWKELGWELFVAKGRYSFAVSWGESGRPEPTPTPGHPPLPRGTFTEGGDEAGIELLSHSPALTEEYIRENRYEALNPGTETDTTDGGEVRSRTDRTRSARLHPDTCRRHLGGGVHLADRIR